MENTQINKNEALRKAYAAMLADFKVFLRYVWAFLGLPEPTPTQYAIADYLQHGPRRSILMGFRGVGKSWITAAFVVWLLLRNPQEKILVVSASKQRADDFSTFTLRLIKELPITRHLIPKPDQRESKVAFDVGPATNSQSPSVTSKGITSQITGSRATRIIADDIEVAQNSITQDMREKLLRAVAEFDAIIVPEGETQITYLGTPQTEESIYNKLRERGYVARVWPALYPENPDVYNGALAPEILEVILRDPTKVGTSTDPRRFTLEDLMERRMSYGPSGFSLQFMLDCSLSDAERYPLRTSDLIVLGMPNDKAPVSIAWSTSPDGHLRDIPNIGFTGDRWYRPMFVSTEWTGFEGIVMSIDPSGRGADEIAYAIVGQLHGILYVLDCGGFKGGYAEENLHRLARIAKLYGTNRVIIEANFGDGMFTSIFSPVLMQYHRCGIEEVRHSKQKELRIIDTLEPVMGSHRLVVNEALVRRDTTEAREQDQNYSLFYQMTRITRDRGALKHDDRLDALAIAVAYWVEAMGKNEEKAVEHWRSRLLDEELRLFKRGVVDTLGMSRGRNQRSPSVFTSTGHIE